MDETAYVRALLLDLEGELERAKDRRIETIFIGGGTPSLFRAESIATLLEGVKQRAPLSADAEITLEANPGTAESGKFTGFRQAGVNRLSIGVQSFDAGHLGRLGRIHGREEALQAVALAREAGFDQINLDLMFGLPEQTLDEVLADIRQALSLAPSHLSFYQLTLEPNTLFQKYPPPLPDEDTVWGLQQASQSLLRQHGFFQYEVSAYSLPGARCRHNMNYWQFGDYLGIGAGAHGKITNDDNALTRTWKIRHPQHYLDAAGQCERQGGQAEIARDDVRFEFLMNALRLCEGFTLPLFRARTGLDPMALEPELSACVSEGLLEITQGHVRCSAAGFNFLDSVLQRFLT